MKNKLFKFFVVLLLFFGVFFITVSIWIPKNFGNTINMSQIVFLLSNPLEGTDRSLVYSFIEVCLCIPALCTFIVYKLIFFKYRLDFSIRIHYKNKQRSISILKTVKSFSLIACVVLFCLSFSFCANQVDLYGYVNNLMNHSTIYEKYYVNPAEVKYEFPEQKRNLVYIYLESMETTYLSKQLGGASEDNLIPELYQLSQENISFVDHSNRGFFVPEGTEWTVAAMVAQSSGVNLNIPIERNIYGLNGNRFLPGAYTLGDILTDAGYQQELLIGSDATFGGRNTYFSDHGNYKIVDFLAAKENQWIDEDYTVGWWGFEDKKLFEYAKNELTTLSSQSQPFNLTLLTVDTHFPNGYLDETCPTPYDNQYSNVISCSSSMVNEFVRWIQAQPFYENTTIVICGDHLSMDADWFANIDSKYKRRGFNVFINSASELNSDNHRRTSSEVDMFPTTIASMGITFEGNRLGLGTNLFSKEKTLTEKMGLKKFNEQMARYSVYYNEHILK